MPPPLPSMYGCLKTRFVLVINADKLMCGRS